MAHSQSTRPMTTATIPFSGRHGGIVIGKGGSTINGIKNRFGCNIEAKKPDHTKEQFLPYFLIEGPHLKAVNLASLEIYRLLMISYMNTEKKQKQEIEEQASELFHLNLQLKEKDMIGSEDKTSSKPGKKRPPPLVLPPTPIKSSAKVCMLVGNDDDSGDSGDSDDGNTPV